MDLRGFFIYLNTECMKFLECDLEEIIYNSDRKKLEERGLLLDGKIFRQLKIGNYGVADLVTFKKPSYDGSRSHLSSVITVYELKKDNISVSAFFQAIRYVRGIQRYLEAKDLEWIKDVHFRVVLIGKDLDLNSSVSYLPNIISYDYEYGRGFSVEMHTYSYGIEGLEFEPVEGYKLINEGFGFESFDDVPF